jgi:hypothetical protein
VIDEDDAVTGLERLVRVYDNAIRDDSGDGTERETVMATEARGHEPLMVHPIEPPVKESARIDASHLILLGACLGRGEMPKAPFLIGARGRCDVLGRLKPSLDLEGLDPEIYKSRDII